MPWHNEPLTHKRHIFCQGPPSHRRQCLRPAYTETHMASYSFWVHGAQMLGKFKWLMFSWYVICLTNSSMISLILLASERLHQYHEGNVVNRQQTSCPSHFAECIGRVSIGSWWFPPAKAQPDYSFWPLDSSEWAVLPLVCHTSIR